MDNLETTSGPVDPCAPSILDLPAELREFIYLICFIRDGPVLLHNRDAYDAMFIPLSQNVRELRDEHVQRFPDDTLSRYFIRSEEDFQRTFESDVDMLKRSKEFEHEFGSTINLLATCRQIYHEASGILYGRNSFTFSRILSRHDIDTDDPWHPRSQQEAYHQAHYAPLWLRSIGRNFKFLREVQIDLDATCGAFNCEGNDESFIDLLPLMKIKWEMALCDIKFVHTGRFIEATGDYHDPFPPSLWIDEHDARPVDQVVFYNNLLQTLGDKDTLMISRHNNYRHLRALIFSFNKYGEGYRNSGYALFGRPGPLCNALRVESESHSSLVDTVQYRISVSKDGRTVKWSMDQNHTQQESRLFTLPAQALAQIRRYVEQDPEEFAIDVDTHSVRNVDLDLFRVCKFFLHAPPLPMCIGGHYLINHQDRHLTISGLYHRERRSTSGTVSNEEVVKCDIMDFLFARNRAASLVRYMAWTQLTDKGPRTVTLEIRIRNDSDMEAQVDLRSFLRLLVQSHINAATTFLAFSYEDTESERGWRVSELAISLLRLRQHLFMHLCDFLHTEAPSDPEMTPILVDRNWNIITTDGARKLPPTTHHDWFTFVNDPASTYNRIKERMARDREHYMEQEYCEIYVIHNWYFLEELLIERAGFVENRAMTDSESYERLCLAAGHM